MNQAIEIDAPERAEQTLKVRLLEKGPTNSTVFVLGSTGSGKTTLIANLLLDKPRFVLVDSKDDFTPQFFGDPEVKVAGNASDLIDLLNAGEKRIIYRLPSGADSYNDVERCCSILIRFQRANSERLPPVTLVLDELNQFVSVNECGPNLADVIQRGRSLRIEKILGAQWFGTIPTWCRDSFSEVWAFRHTDPAGLARLQEFGFDMDEIKFLPQFTVCHAKQGIVERVSLVSRPFSDSTQKEKGRENR